MITIGYTTDKNLFPVLKAAGAGILCTGSVSLPSERPDFYDEEPQGYIYIFISFQELAALVERQKDFKALLDPAELKRNRLTIKCLEEGFNSDNPAHLENLEFYKYVTAAWEQKTIEKRKKGVQKAAEANKYKGRQPKEIDTEQLRELYDLYLRREISMEEITRHLGITKSTVYRRFKGLRKSHL